LSGKSDLNTRDETLRKLVDELAKNKRSMARQETDLVRILLTLDDSSHLELVKGVHYDETIDNALGDLFRNATDRLRVAMPYISDGGRRDFDKKIESTLEGTANVLLLFRYPDNGKQLQVHREINKRYGEEIASGKIQIRFFGEAGSSGLHAKVVIMDDALAMISSANWTSYSLSSNAEAGILTSSRRAIMMLQRWFDHIYERSYGWSAVESRPKART
jgi:hypothetical protein